MLTNNHITGTQSIRQMLRVRTVSIAGVLSASQGTRVSISGTTCVNLLDPGKLRGFCIHSEVSLK
jgi:hypothetical protein